MLAIEDAALKDFVGNLLTDWNLNLWSCKAIPASNRVLSIGYKKGLEKAYSNHPTSYTVTLTPMEDGPDLVQVNNLLATLKDPTAVKRCTSEENVLKALNLALCYYGRKAPQDSVIDSNVCYQIESHNPHNGNPTLFQRIPGPLTIARGWSLSLQPGSNGFCLNINAIYGSFYPAMNLADMIRLFKDRNADNDELHATLKGVKVEVPYLKKKDLEKDLKSQRSSPGIRKVFGLAQKNDGAKRVHPPKVLKDGAAAEEIKFWCKDNAGETKPFNIDDESGSGTYRTVMQYFQQSEYLLSLRLNISLT